MSGSRCSGTAAYPERVSILPVRAGEQTVVSITPENGGSLTEAPDQVEVTFVRSLQGADVSATSAGPSTPADDVAVRVDGSTVLVPVSDDGPGDYTVAVTVDGATSSTGFSVLPAGQQPAPEQVTYGPVVVGAVLLAILLVAVLTLRRWFGR